MPVTIFPESEVADIETVDNVAALKALVVAGVPDGQMITTRGYYTENDGGQGTYVYDSGSVAVDNGGTVIAPNAGGGRYLLLSDGVINVRQFGAKGDGVADDTATIQNALNAVVEDLTPSPYPFGGTYGSMVYLPDGQYNISATLYPKRGTNLFGSSRAAAVLNVTLINVTGIIYYKQGSTNVGSDLILRDFTVKTASNSWVPTSGTAIRISSSFMEGPVVSYNAGVPSIVLGGNASSVTGSYVGRSIYINGSTLNSATVTAYDGVTKTATLAAAFPTPPVPGDTYNVIGSGQNNIQLSNITVYGKFFDGFWVEATVVSQFDRLRSALSQRYGFRFEDVLRVTPTSMTVSNCYASNSGSHGYYFSDLRYCSIDGCAADANTGDAYNMFACQSVAMVGCGAEGNTGAGLNTNICFNISQTSCRYIGCGTHAVRLTSSAQNSATACTFNPTAAANNAVRIDLASSNAAQGNDIICIGCDTTATTFTNNYTVVSTIQRNGFNNISGSTAIGAGVGGVAGQTITRLKRGTAVLVAGTVVVPETQVTANSQIQLTCQTPAGTPGFLYVSARAVGVSFTVTSSNVADTSTIAFLLIEP